MRTAMRVLTAAATLTTVLAALSGCSATVRVDPPTPVGAAADACRALAGELPRRLDGLDRVSSEPASPYVAVWGKGQIALRCGVSRPANMAATAEVLDVNGIGWFQDPQRPTLFTAVNRVAYVELTIARTHAVGTVLVDLADPIKKAVPQ